MSSVLADLTPLRGSAPYRRLWFGTTVSMLGQQMTALAVAVQVYSMTGSNFSVGLVGLFSLAPLIAFGLIGGAIADSMDRRKLGLFASTGLAAMSLVLALQAVLGLDQVWLLYGVVAAQSAFFAVNSPTRAAMIPRLIPPEQLPAANALSMMSMTLGMTLGPLLGGLVMGLWNVETVYVVDALAFGAALYAMWRLPDMPPERGPGKAGEQGESGEQEEQEEQAETGPPKRASVADGLRFLRSRPNVRMTFLADIAAMVFGMPRALFPAIAVAWYGGGTNTVGILTAAIAVGAFAGAVFSGPLGSVRYQGRAVIVSIVVWGLAIAAFGMSNWLWLGVFFLAVAGAADTVSGVFRNTILQVATPDDMRGRLSGVFIVVVAGGPRLGDFESGSVAALTTERISVISGGLACVAVVVALALRWPGFWRYDAKNPQP
ncbi:MFS transporter [Yinghuangia soli]|uniref:MFS transporter n=1 Tax=Yinghuangia soli TaxID=2908204 RepID=A0AA41Q2C6_9ACTN|nr:MFS transporter [Yinghuangia soli]MCF2529461.1 MFS transporter [Yinghuangia soli]